jgi:GT2 family glycosyltransferase
MTRTLIIILCYNGVVDTLACLESLRRVTHPSFDTLVVDNASQDGTPLQVRQHFPEVAVIETGANLGFAAGNNVGLRYALERGYDYALLLNNDTVVDPDFLTLLISTAQQNPEAGVVGPTIYYYDQPDLIWSAGGSINWKIGQTTMYTDPAGPESAEQPRAVAFVTGCALLISRAAIERAGLLDERFFMYYEETEWCVRVGRAGFTILHVPAAKIWHKIPLNARCDKEYIAYYMTRNRLLFLRLTQAPLLAWATALYSDLRTWCSLTLRPKWRHRPGRIGMQQGWSDFWRNRFGMMPQE